MIILWEKYLFRALTTLANIFRNVVHGCLRGSYLPSISHNNPVVV